MGKKNLFWLFPNYALWMVIFILLANTLFAQTSHDTAPLGEWYKWIKNPFGATETFYITITDSNILGVDGYVSVMTYAKILEFSDSTHTIVILWINPGGIYVPIFGEPDSSFLYQKLVWGPFNVGQPTIVLQSYSLENTELAAKTSTTVVASDTFERFVSVKKRGLTASGSKSIVCSRIGSGTFILSSNGNIAGQLQIIDISGRIILKEQIGNSYSKRIDLNRLSAGMYLYRLQLTGCASPVSGSLLRTW
jgi:hypothetical protein